jgi:WD40 repeat protein
MGPCPSNDELEQLLNESLSDPEATRVLAHIEECTHCQASLQWLADATPGPSDLSSLSSLERTAFTESTSEAKAFLQQIKRQIAPPDSPKLGIDGYDIEEEIGRGAAAVVYRARQHHLGRYVALKVIPAGPHLSPDIRERFRREAETIARLQHPNIVQVYDVGEQNDCLYLALELVEAGGLTSWLGVPLPPVDAARLIATLATAIDYAHRQGVVHRDLKPANILLKTGEHGFQPKKLSPSPNAVSSISSLQSAILKVTDFGLAKLLPTPGVVEDRMTQSGAILGTPAYAAPEQATGNASEVGRTADVYSMGVILYELLTGRPPFQGANAMETLVQVVHHAPVPPSRLVPQVPRDLQTVCLKCLEKDPRKRYATAGELADDLERFLDHEPVRARPVGWGELALQWSRRNRGTASALVGIAVLLLLLVTGSLLAAAYYQRQEEVQHGLFVEKQRLANEKERLASEKEAEREKAVQAERRQAALRQLAEKQGETLSRHLYIAQMNLAGQAAASSGGIGRVVEILAQVDKDRPDLRNWEWYYLNGLCHRDLLTVRAHQDGVMAVAWSPDGRRVASESADGLILLWDAANGGALRALQGVQGAAQSLAWRPDGKELASACLDGTVKVFDLIGGKDPLVLDAKRTQLNRTTRGARAVLAVAWSPDGKRLASAGEDCDVHVWDAANGREVQVLKGHNSSVRGLAWSPDGKRLASASEDTTVQIWDPLGGKGLLTLRGHLNWATSVAWNPSGTLLASASNDHTVKVWDISLGKEVTTLRGHSQSVSAVAWSPDGTRLATASEDRTVKIWPAAGGSEAFTMRGHMARATAVAWSPDGKQLASASADATVKIWDTAPRAASETPILREEGSPTFSIAWRPDGAQFACACSDGNIRIWDRAGDRAPLVLRGHQGWVRFICFSADGRHLASGGQDRTVRIWDTAGGKELKRLAGHTDAVTSVSWSPEGTRLASASFDKTIRVWDAISGEPTQVLRGHKHWVLCVAWSADGKRLASGSADLAVKMWDVESHRETLSLPADGNWVNSVAFSPDGKCLASASEGGKIKIWDSATGRLIHTLGGHNASVRAVAWSADGTRLASASLDRTVKIWDVPTGGEMLTLGGHESPINAVAWSPDGMTIVSGGDDQNVVFHDATAGYVARRSPKYLPALDRKLAAHPQSAQDWLLRGEIHVNARDWDQAAADFKQYLALTREMHWVISGWWVAGPYPDVLSQSYPPERNLDPHNQRGAVEQDVAAATWERVPVSTSGFVNFGALFDHADHISAYALIRIYAPQQRRVKILLGSGDQVRLWLNRTQIHECLKVRPAMPDSDAVPATLQNGWNTVLVRVVNVTGGHALYLRLVDGGSMSTQ